jgi:hypothetical protein
MEWDTGDGSLIEGSARFAADETDGGDFFATVYFESMDVLAAAAAPMLELRADDTSPADRAQMRETVLLDALHMEAECVHILRQILDRGSRSPETLALALETLRNANEVLGDEARAWHALSVKRQKQLAFTPMAAWENYVEYNWSHALEEVAVDVQSLTGRVLALQTLNS